MIFAGHPAKQNAPTALVMDHRLRSESAAEAEQAMATAQRLGLQTVLLKAEWPGGIPTKGQLMNSARLLRYNAMAAKCAELSIPWLLTGHHAGNASPTCQYNRAPKHDQRPLSVKEAFFSCCIVCGSVVQMS